MTKEKESPINMIVFPVIKNERQAIIDSFVDISMSCRTESEFRSTFEIFYDEIYKFTMKSILLRDIENKAALLEELKDA